MGATVVVTVRSAAKGEDAVACLKLAAGHERVSYLICDFLSLHSVRLGLGLGLGLALGLGLGHERASYLLCDFLSLHSVITQQSRSNHVAIT